MQVLNVAFILDDDEEKNLFDITYPEGTTVEACASELATTMRNADIVCGINEKGWARILKSRYSTDFKCLPSKDILKFIKSQFDVFNKATVVRYKNGMMSAYFPDETPLTEDQMESLYNATIALVKDEILESMEAERQKRMKEDTLDVAAHSGKNNL